SFSFESEACSTVIGALNAIGALAISEASTCAARALAGSINTRLQTAPSSERCNPKYHEPAGIVLLALVSGISVSCVVRKLLARRYTWPFVILSNAAESSYSFFQIGRP